MQKTEAQIQNQIQKTTENISWIKEKNEDLELIYHKTISDIKTSAKNDMIDLKFFSEFLYKQNCINQVKNYFLRIVDYDIDRISASKTDLTFQKKISIHFNPRLVFNIDVFSETAFSNGSEHFTEDKIYASLKRALDIFDQKFCLKSFIPVASDEHQVNFKLFVFQEDDNYAQFSTKNDVDPNQFYAFTDPSLKENYISNMYVNLNKCYSKKINTLSLIKSAFVRALTLYVTGKTALGPIVMEGLSEYISRSEEGDISSDFAAFYMEKDKYLNLTEIIEAGFFDTKNFNEPLNEKKSFLYSVAPTVIAYLEDTNLNFINFLLKSVNNQRNLEDSGQFNELLKIVYNQELKKEKEGGGLKAWVQLKLEEDDYYNDSLFSDLTCQQRLEQQLASLMIDDVNQFASSNFVNASHLADSKKKEADLAPAYVISSPI